MAHALRSSERHPVHFCQDEAAALVGALGSLRIAWVWLKTKLRVWWQRRRKP